MGNIWKTTSTKNNTIYHPLRISVFLVAIVRLAHPAGSEAIEWYRSATWTMGHGAKNWTHWWWRVPFCSRCFFHLLIFWFPQIYEQISICFSVLWKRFKCFVVVYIVFPLGGDWKRWSFVIGVFFWLALAVWQFFSHQKLALGTWLVSCCSSVLPKHQEISKWKSTDSNSEIARNITLRFVILLNVCAAVMSPESTDRQKSFLGDGSRWVADKFGIFRFLVCISAIDSWKP